LESGVQNPHPAVTATDWQSLVPVLVAPTGGN